ncbi:helix-turn-helix transcriptional regulator [Acidisphaera rubrifaciens]|uniref:Transcriptional regulator AraC n=1 Tax=Acidisphaera rubrifaciens HS-AP3 TaxID=1231350 RepID=A0A0D6P6Q0_9PROT|nr:helix-turn-helix domain-containing protein [Acidisphaera rubrifaciens]GAN76549.1 transcriptional regulator AraC [Acidisphaera rubrifaciens HS-AP3]
MSYAVAICHGVFGRAVLFHLDRPMTRHLHRDGHLLFHVDGPPGLLEIAGRRSLLSPLFGVAVNPWEPHAWEPAHRDGTLMLVLYVRPSWFATNSLLCGQGFRFAQSTIEMVPLLGRRVLEIAALLETGAAPTRLDGLLLDLVRECLAQSGTPTDEGAGLMNARDSRIRRSIRLMLEDAGNAVELDAIAVRAGLSRAHFFKLFRSEIGATPGLVRNAMRMERALMDLAETPKPITDIGFDLGFASTSSFSRFFSLNTGLSPTEYRRVARIFGA